jgi:fucose 4-O-acetylase-like acetyltransferase
MISQVLSEKFKFWAFVSMILLVVVHGYNLHERYLQPWSVVDEPLTVTSFTEYFLANGIFRFRIPMLFIVSGYLFACYDFKSRKETIKKRFWTLVIPYLIWSAVGLLLSYLLEMIPYTRQLIVNSYVLQIDETRMLVHDYHWYEVVARWLFFPVSYQLWFIRVLFIYNLAYPLISWCVSHRVAKWVFLSFATLLWLTTFSLPFLEGEGLLFFSLGVLIQKGQFSIEEKMKPISTLSWLTVFVCLSLIKTWLAFKGNLILGDSLFPVITILHKAVVVAGLISAWYVSDSVVKWFMKRKWFVWLSSFSFIIYALHAPFVAFAIDGMFEWLRSFQLYRALTFVLLPTLIIGICVLVGYAIRKISPKFYSLLTGGRGL